MTQVEFSARFEPLGGHRTLTVRRAPSSAAKAQVLVLPAFGDEMNQMRRMVRLTTEALATHGVASTMFDLHGTGDSSASFEEATIERWLDDGERMLSRLARETPLVLLGCRLGAALAVELTHRVATPICGMIAWSACSSSP